MLDPPLVNVWLAYAELNVRNVEELVIQKDKAEHEAETCKARRWDHYQYSRVNPHRNYVTYVS